MTAWKDEPPLTRRQIRMNERRQRAETGQEASPDSGAPLAAVVPEQDRSVAAVPDAPARDTFGRDAARSKVPSYSGPSFRNSAAGQATTQAGASPMPAAGWQPAAPANPLDHDAVLENELDPLLADPSETHSTGEHQLTRRELRALRAQSGGPHPPELRQPTTAAAEAVEAAESAETPVETKLAAWPLARLEVPDVESVPADFAQIISAPPVDVAPDAALVAEPVAEPEYPLVDVTHDLGSVAEEPRDLSSTGAITANALVLPSMPETGDAMRPINDTGEILITGSVELPASLGATGSYPTHYDRSDVDALIEADDREDSAADSAPVRAVRAVSTHAATPGMVVGRVPRQSRFPLVLVVVAAAMAVGVVVLIVAGFIFKIF